MAKEICISSTPHETRLAILEDDQLAEIYYERENEYTLAGSIYNGRVTRVLPGMQSAFVDLGLERDAFLYVTDFLELEDQEESEELEKAAAGGATQAPREVRRGDGRGPRPDDRKDERNARNGQRQEQRPQRERRPEPAAAVPAEAVLTPAEPPDAAEPSGEPEGEAGGARRWRGRRRRRGGRGHGGAPEGRHEGGEAAAGQAEEPEAAEPSPAVFASPSPAAAHSEALPTAAKFVLPGESLSKYGGAPSAGQSKPEAPAAPPRPASTFKPVTLIEKPIEWDGSGLLPGESLSRHRRQQEAGHEIERAPNLDLEAAPDAIEERALIEEHLQEHSEFAPPVNETEVRIDTEDPFESAFFKGDATSEEVSPGAGLDAESAYYQAHQERAPEHVFVRMDFDDPDAHEIPEPVSLAAESGESQIKPGIEGGSEPSGEEDSPGPETNRDASHHIDPLPPSGFRLFGLGGKKKKGDESEAEAPRPMSQSGAKTASAPAEMPAGKPASVASAFAPGTGLVEEEVIEGEEYDLSAHHHHKTEEHDFDDFEEETLQTQIRSGELGELLQEAHLDHHIARAFGDKSGDEAVEEDVAEEEEEEEETENEPAEAGRQGTGEPSAPQRRERSFRGRRGRPGQGPRGRGAARRSAQTSDLPIISDLLKPGQEILVQIAKEPIAKKGARITSHIALPGRFLVFMPTVGHVGVSRKIASDEERHRLKRILISERGEASGGFIVRTAAEGASEEELRADLRFLLHLWEEIKTRSESSKSPSLIYHDLGLIERILRDQMSANFASIWVDSEADYERIVRFLNHVSPSLVRRVKLYTKETPLFEHFGIQDEISKALRSKVWLKSGGSIVINQTEALVAIDINTGKYVGKSARLEDTILKTNLDAVPEIVRQIRLRDLGGIIVIDFIDMDERKNRFKVMAALEEALKTDRAPTKVLQFNDFGLVAITRKRVKQSLERTLSVPCPTCQATGMVKSPATVANEIYIELRKMKKHFENSDVLLRVNPETVKVLKANNESWLQEFEELTGKNILVKSDATLHPEQFDIQG